MRICLVSRECSPFQGGGIGTYVALAAEAFRDLGHDVQVITAPHVRLSEAPVLFPGIRFTAVDLESGRAARLRSAPGALRYSFAVWDALERLSADAPFDLVEFPEFGGEGAMALEAKRQLGCFPDSLLAVRVHTPSRDVRELNGDWALDLNRLWEDALEQSCMETADVLFAPAQSMLERVMPRLSRNGPSLVIPHPFPLSQRTLLGVDRAMPPQVADGADMSRVLFVGRLERRKGPHLLVEAAQRLFSEGLDFRVEFVGGDTPTGPRGSSFRSFLDSKISERWRARFVFHPNRSRTELGALLGSVDVCAFPSLWENHPNVCLEAMAAGRPVVASNAGGMAEMVEDGVSGLLHVGGDVSSLAARLREVLQSPGVRERLGQAAVSRVQSLNDPASFVQAMISELRRWREAKPTPGASSASEGRHAPVRIFDADREEWVSLALDDDDAPILVTRFAFPPDGQTLDDAANALRRNPGLDCLVLAPETPVPVETYLLPGPEAAVPPPPAASVVLYRARVLRQALAQLRGLQDALVGPDAWTVHVACCAIGARSAIFAGEGAFVPTPEDARTDAGAFVSPDRLELFSTVLNSRADLLALALRFDAGPLPPKPRRYELADQLHDRLRSMPWVTTALRAVLRRR